MTRLEVADKVVYQPTVSVLMPVLNEEASVAQAIRSILAQDVPVEVLVADAGSTDATIAKITAMNDSRIKIFANPKRNIPSGLNTALAHAEGQFIARVDAHASINDEYLRTAISCLEDPTIAAVGGLKKGVARTATGRAISVALGSRFGVGNSIYHYGQYAQDTDHASFGVYRTDVARKIAGWDEMLAVNEDVDFDYRIQKAGYRIRFEPSMVVSWNVRETLFDFARQYRRYGRGKAQMVRKNGPSAIRMRHLIAPLLVFDFCLAGACVIVRRPKFAVLLASPYAVAITAVAASSIQRHTHERQRNVSVSRLVGAFVVMHFSWGFGFLEHMLLGSTPALGSAREKGEVRPD